MKPTPHPSQPAADAMPRSVLVVDDDPFMLDVMRDLLGDLGVRDIRTARDGEEAARQLQRPEQHPDLVICDLKMPGKDGFLLMEDLAAQRYKGRVVVASGMDARTLNSAALMARFHRLRIAGTLSKPVDEAALAGLLLGH